MTMAQDILVDTVRRALKTASKVSAKRRWPLTNDELDELAYSVLPITERRFRKILAQHVAEDTVLHVDLPLVRRR